MQYRYSEAIEMYSSILSTKESVFGVMHASSLATRYNLACCYKDYCDYLSQVCVCVCLYICICLCACCWESECMCEFDDCGFISPFCCIFVKVDDGNSALC